MVGNGHTRIVCEVYNPTCVESQERHCADRGVFVAEGVGVDVAVSVVVVVGEGVEVRVIVELGVEVSVVVVVGVGVNVSVEVGVIHGFASVQN